MRTEFSPLSQERWVMRLGVAANACVFLPVLWRAPEPIPLATLAIFVPFLAVFLLAQGLRRRWPLQGVLASHAASVVLIGLAVATPLLYPRSFAPGVEAWTYARVSAGLTGAALLGCAGGFAVLHFVRSSSASRSD